MLTHMNTEVISIIYWAQWRNFNSLELQYLPIKLRQFSQNNFPVINFIVKNMDFKSVHGIQMIINLG